MATVLGAAFSARFWARVDRSGGLLACWPWRGGRTLRQRKTWTATYTWEYGVLWSPPAPTWHARKRLLAHRVACILDDPSRVVTWEEYLELAAAQRAYEACHQCDFGLCCNPACLYWDTHQGNMADYIRKYGRIAARKEARA